MRLGPNVSGRRIRVGLIGAAVDTARSWGSRAHIPALRYLSEHFELTAVCTASAESAAAAAQHFGVGLAFADARAMAEHRDVDLVVVSVRTPLHREMVAAAVAARKHVYCEWPLGTSTAEAAEMLETTRGSGVLDVIGMQGRYNEGIVYARDLIAQGYIGRPVSVTVKVTQEIFGPDEKRKNIYTTDARNGASILQIATGQALEAVCYCVGELRDVNALVSNQHPTARVIETGELIAKSSPDQVLIDGTLTSGAVFSFHMRGGASKATAASRLEINGTEGDLLLTSDGPANLHRAKLTLHGARRGESSLCELTIPAEYSRSVVGLAEGPARYLAHHYLHIARALQTGEPGGVDFAHALNWQRKLDLVQQASDTGIRQQLN